MCGEISSEILGFKECVCVFFFFLNSAKIRMKISSHISKMACLNDLISNQGLQTYRINDIKNICTMIQ